MSGASGPGSDWVSGERVFAPPSGTLDVDWLVPAVLEAVPGATPSQARAALLTAWRDGCTSRPEADPQPGTGPQPEDPSLRLAAEQVVAEALRTFRA